MQKNNLFILFKAVCFTFAILFLGSCFAKTGKTVHVEEAYYDDEITQNISNFSQSQEYILQPGDLVEIKVFMEESMTRTLRISGTGFVTFPLIGNGQIGGESISSAEAKMAADLRNYLKNPQISILVKEYGSKTVFVLGQVKKPTSVPIPPEKNLTVLEAITSAGGFTDIAAPSKVRVLRMENGQQRSINVDVTQITRHGNKAQDINLLPGDVVFVPQSIF